VSAAPAAVRRARLWAWGWTALAAALLLLRVPPPVEELAGLVSLDKLAHVALFFAVARSWLGALGARSTSAVAAVVAAAAAYGGLLELAQTLGDRHGDALDALADALGAALAPLGRGRRL
jgi:VanZ family protein